MARQVNALVQVTTVANPAWPDPRPASFRYRGTLIRVTAVLDRWHEAGRWWEREPERVAWRVTDVAGGVYELVMERTTPPAWRLMVIWD
ncbi:MAG TPA: DUF6504 family protein [Symbiobacteriaceae bacterium]